MQSAVLRGHRHPPVGTTVTLTFTTELFGPKMLIVLRGSMMKLEIRQIQNSGCFLHVQVCVSNARKGTMSFRSDTCVHRHSKKSCVVVKFDAVVQIVSML